jgi:hypothetical protein
MAAVHINGITEVFKCVKRNTHRQQYIQGVKTGAKQIIDGINKEIGVFKIEQQPQVKNDTADEQQFFPSFILLSENGIGQNIIHNSRQNYKNYKYPAGFVKKIQGEKTENIPAQLKVVPELIIKPNEEGEEENKEPVVK